MKKLFTFLSLLMVSVGIWAQQGDFNDTPYQWPGNQNVQEPTYFTLTAPYDTNGSHYFSTYLYGTISTNEQDYTDNLSIYEVAAYVGDECRAVATPRKINGEWVLMINVWSKDDASVEADTGKPITFKIYNARLGKEYTLNVSQAVT